MDVGFKLPSVFMILFNLFLKDASCQVYSWSVSVPLNTSVCSNSLSNPLTLDWTYTPTTPDPLIIEWSRPGTGSTFNAIASYSGSAFTTSAAYTGRISRTGSTAEIAIQGPLTAADGGVYQVAVTDSVGNGLSGFAYVIFPVVNEPVNASCVETAANVYNVTCSVDVSPPVTLQLKKGIVLIDSAPSDSGLSSTQSGGGTFQCSVTGQGSECVTPNSAEVTCIGATTTTPSQPTETTTATTLPTSPPTSKNNTSAPVPVPDPCDCAWYAVIILVVLLVVKIVTDGIFVGYRWGDKCKQNIDKKRNILYRICFVQGIINSICGVVFIIIICLAYPECLGKALAIAALVISIIVLITGLIYIVMFLCKQNIDKKRNILNWICFVQGIINSICGVVFIIIICATYPECLGKGLPIAALVLCIIVGITGVINIAIVFVHPGDKRTPAPSSPPPIPPSMASPRKPPVPPSSTTPRTLPNPTSDPASDSAVNPTVHLEPLSVEEPKKKKKKRKKRKNINGETSDRPMNTTRDSDE